MSYLTKDESHYFFDNSEAKLVLTSENVPKLLAQAQEEIQEKLDDYNQNGTGGMVEEIVRFYIDIAKYSPFKGSSYIDLPPYYKK